MSLNLGILYLVLWVGLMWGACYAVENFHKGVTWKTPLLIIYNVLFWYIAIPISIVNGTWNQEVYGWIQEDHEPPLEENDAENPEEQ